MSGLRIEPGIATNIRGSGQIAIIEFSDYECPFCATQARDTFPEIERNLVEAGKVQYIAFGFPLERIHTQALKASEAAECAARQGQFWQMHERLFEESPALSPFELVRYAEELGLDRSRFETCLEDKVTTAKVRSDQSYGRSLEVTSTPSFFVGIVQENGAIDLVKRIRGTFSFDELMDELTDLL